MAVLLTSTCRGNVATALCNTVISNLLGIFITPALLFHFFGGAMIELPFLGLVAKLCKKVMLPVGEETNGSHPDRFIFPIRPPK